VANRYKLPKKKELTKYRLFSETGLNVSILPNGKFLSINYNEIMFNQLLGSVYEKPLSNIYLRLHDTDGIKSIGVAEKHSDSKLRVGKNGLQHSGIVDSIKYECSFVLSNNEKVWYYIIDVINTSKDSVKLDFVYNQDLGLANEASIRTNELYTSQYIDYKILQHPQMGYSIACRQNQKQDGKHPWLLMGALNEVENYSTDGYQFYGLDYKESNEIAALKDKELCNEVYQYEFAMPALQSRITELQPGNAERMIFYAYFVEDHTEASSDADLKLIDRINEDSKSLSLDQLIDVDYKEDFIIGSDCPVFQSEEFDENKLSKYYPELMRNKEYIDDKLMSFFYADNQHVVLKGKELLVERTHGNISLSGNYFVPDDRQLAVTSWMNGIFSSHVSIGNTSFNKFLSVSKNGLNVEKNCGQRIFLEEDNQWHLLGVPSVYEMGLNYSRWLYKDEDHLIEVKVWTSNIKTASFLEVNILEGKPTRFIIQNSVMAGNLEYDNNVQVQVIDKDGCVIIQPDGNELISKEYADAHFGLISKDKDLIDKIDVISMNDKDLILPLIRFNTKVCKQFSLALTGSILEPESFYKDLKYYSTTVDSFEKSVIDKNEQYKAFSQYARFTSENKSIQELNELMPWYAHNALIHFTSPHGLEQYSGAAWGLRDVCQGPAELLETFEQKSIFRDLILKVYSMQIHETGDWNQWFMIDKFSYIQDANSHNDIIAWPLKALCDYIESTNDFSILSEEVDYIDAKELKPMNRKESIMSHTLLQIDKMLNDTIDGTTLIKYGHGDWEDTLQPSNEELRENLVSPWTVSLVYENLHRYQKICKRFEAFDLSDSLTKACQEIRDDYNKYLIKDDIVCGLAYFGKDNIKHMLHPTDEETGVKYRLIPMNRGILSGILTKDQTEKHLEIIDTELKFVDGVHLMDKPLKYNGGKESFFKRAETGANFGREIGLQYIHAHIRYLEALAFVGDGDRLFDGLMIINHIGIGDRLESALPRQRNCYYSSSDADFLNRYDSYDNFKKINKYEVGIKGGWRVYSSGPGIYLAQIITHFLGVKHYFDDVLLDPVIPKKLSGLTYTALYDNIELEYKYIINRNNCSPYKIIINGEEMRELKYMENPYRSGGVLISRERFKAQLTKKMNRIEIYM